MHEFEMVGFAAHVNKTTNEGVDMQLVRDFLTKLKCMQLAPFSSHLCADFIINTYKLEEAKDDKERAVRITEFLGTHNTYVCMYNYIVYAVHLFNSY